MSSTRNRIEDGFGRWAGAVVRWRWQQEQDLSPGEHLMDRNGVVNFVMFYERISRRMLQLMPDQADLVLELGVDHEFTASRLRQS